MLLCYTRINMVCCVTNNLIDHIGTADLVFQYWLLFILANTLFDIL